MASLRVESTEYFVKGENHNYWITQINQEKPLNHVKSQYELGLEKLGSKVNKNWFICCMRYDTGKASKWDFQSTFVGFEHGFSCPNEAFYILELYLKKEFDMLIWLGEINR